VNGQVITLPPQPEIGTTVEILDGQNEGNRFKRVRDDVWVETTIGSHLTPVTAPREVHWSWIWWAVCEDGSGGTSVRVIPPDPHPLPWHAAGERDAYVEDAKGRIVCEIEGSDTERKRQIAERICAAVNAARDRT
jgi:hypothetical protein